MPNHFILWKFIECIGRVPNKGLFSGKKTKSRTKDQVICIGQIKKKNRGRDPDTSVFIFRKCSGPVHTENFEAKNQSQDEIARCGPSGWPNSQMRPRGLAGVVSGFRFCLKINQFLLNTTENQKAKNEQHRQAQATAKKTMAATAATNAR